jgi:phospholipid/cholesterol/gamma-HCH transport system permease protein
MPSRIFGNTGRFIIDSATLSGRAMILLNKAMLAGITLLKKPRVIGDPLYICLVRPLILVAAVSFLTGMVLAMQTGRAMQQWGFEREVGGLVAVAMAREMGPLWAAVIVTAAVGSSIAAELGTMKVSEEIDALEVMAIDPVRFLVMPRIFALVLAVPILAVYADAIGFLGGGFIARSMLGVPFHQYMDSARSFVETKDLWSGAFKAVWFGLAIGVIACDQGMNTSGGAEGVGKTTINTVVLSIIMILVINFILSAIFFPKA